MNNHELRAAAERVIEWYETVRHYGGVWGELAGQIVLLARQYLAEHPADDGEPVAEERLLAAPGVTK